MSRKRINFRTPYNFSNRNIEQLIIRVGKGCNFKCVFCNVSDNEKNLDLKPIIKEILAYTLYKIKFSNFKSNLLNITISGGEPSIFQKETLFILKYFSKYFYEKGIDVFFDLQTNASNIDINFSNNLVKYGIKSSMVSFHTINPLEYKELIGVSYDIFGKKVFTGVKNLINSGIEVSFNIILNDINKYSFFETVKYLIENFSEVIDYNIGFVQPHGMANKNNKDLNVQYKDISYIYNKTLSYIKFKGKKASSHFVGLPLCYINDFSDSLEYYTNKNLIKNGVDSETLIHNINDTNKIYTKDCQNCLYKRYCSGIWKEFEGYQELKPYIYFKYFQKYDLKICRLYNSGDSIKKIYDSGIRQIFIDYKSYIELIDDIYKNNFFIISIIGLTDYQNIDINSLIGCNLQFDFINMDLLFFITKILDFNKSKSSHFKIKIDINLTEIDNKLLYLIPTDNNLNINLINIDKKLIKNNSRFTFYYS